MRHALPLCRTDSASAGRDAFGALILDGGFVGSDGEPCRSLTLLLDFSGRAEGARVAQMLAASMLHTHGRWQSFAGASAIGAFLDALHSRPAAELSSVIVLPNDPSESRHCRAALEAIVASTVHAIGAVVAVSGEPSRWSGLRGITGHVACEPGNAYADAAAVFSVQAACNAPHLLACFDVEDLKLAFGTDAAPAVVVHAIWPGNERQGLVLPAAKQAVHAATESDVVLLAPLWQRASLSEARCFMNQARTAVGHDASLFFALTEDFFLGQTMPRAGCPVVMICRNAMRIRE